MTGKQKLLCLKGLFMMAILSAVFLFGNTARAEETSDNCLSNLNAGVEAVMDISSGRYLESITETAKQLHIELQDLDQTDELVMANVKKALNVRSDASYDSKKLGKLYRDCGGTILERKNGWTKIKSGNLIGWANDEYLFFGEEAEEVAYNVGRTVASVNSDVLRVRTEPSTDASVIGMLPSGELIEVLNKDLGEWVMVDYEGQDGYVLAEYITIDFQIDAGETKAEIKAREAAELEARRHVNYGEYTTDADTTLLLAALIQCEAGGEEYEGQLAVASVVMNRVRSAAYPDSIHGVIYASGQFTPAQNGKVNRVYNSGRIKQSCIDAANEALSGVSNVGDMTHFRRNNGRAGLVIGHHVFY